MNRLRRALALADELSEHIPISVLLISSVALFLGVVFEAELLAIAAVLANILIRIRAARRLDDATEQTEAEREEGS